MRDEAGTDLYESTEGLRGHRVIVPDTEQLIDHLAMDLMASAHHRVVETGVFHLALSGGSTPQMLYKQLIIDPRYRRLPWSETHVWIVDERCVPFTDDRSNYKMIRELVLDHVVIDEKHVHPMPVTEPHAAHHYEQKLRAALARPGCGARLDFILLGMGDDGHTASLFPHTEALKEKDRWIVINDGQSVAEPRPRMTMTFPLINTARKIAVLVTGKSKAAMIQKVRAAGGDEVEDYPIRGVLPTFDDGRLTWYLDAAAAGAVDVNS